MNWAPAGPAASARRSASTATPAVRKRVGIGSTLLEQDAGAPDLLGRDDPQEIGEEPVHQLEIRGEGGDLLVLAVEDLLRELLLVEGLAGASVDEVELRVQAEALALEVAVAADEARPVVLVPDHPL